MKLLIVAVYVLLLALPMSLPAAQVDYFLKLPGVEGESTDPLHLAEIDVLSWSWGITQECNNPSALPAVQSINVSKSIDKATPKLAEFCANGQHIPEAKLTCRKAGGTQEEYFTIKLADVLVSSYQTGGSSTDVVPADQVSMCFGGIRITTLRYDLDGNLVEVVTRGFATVPGGPIPPPDDYPGVPTVVMDQLSITGPIPDETGSQTE
jgi:type VI secretion system secreted protein Hcp